MNDKAVLTETLAGLHLFPLTGGAEHEPDLVLLGEALETGTLRVEEVDEQGSVPTLHVVNSGATPVLLLAGDELVGAKQNRVVNSSVLVAADSGLTLPVSCVELDCGATVREASPPPGQARTSHSGAEVPCGA